MFWKRKRIRIDLEHTPLSTPIHELSFTVFDTETTGFFVESEDRLIEIGAVQIVGLNVSDHTFQTYVNPKRAIPDEIVQLTGIDHIQVLKAPEATDAIQSFFQFTQQHKSSCWVGHHPSFDFLALKKELQRSQLNFHKPTSIDTLDLIRSLKPTWNIRELDHYAKSFDTPLFQRHTALGDAQTTAHLFCTLLQKIQEKGYHTWGDLIHIAESQQRMMAFH
jgi:DNA polymerase-3 subunit epsilon